MAISMDELRTYISVFSLAFGIWQYLQNRKIKKLISLEAVELHKNVAVALGATQEAKKAIIAGASPNTEVGRAEGLTQAILFESAKLFCNLRNTSIDDVDDLITNGQLSNGYKDIYYSFSNKRRGLIRAVLKYFRRLY
ncbi:MAG: hypothetical protein ACYC49_10665 [Ignavibacteriaceae bacterium]